MIDVALAKSITYRIISLVITITVAKIATGSWAAAGSIAGVDQLVKLGVYYYHERVWKVYEVKQLQKRMQS